MSDLAFLDSDTIFERHARKLDEIQREAFKRKLLYIANDAERAQDYARMLLRSGADVTDELNELETTANGLLLVAKLLKREASNGQAE